MNAVPALSLVFDPNHVSPDVIDERPPNDPTRQQTGGAVPVFVTPGEPQPVLTTDPQAPVIPGWNIWDVYQAQAPIDPLPGSLDSQLAIWVRTAAELADDAPIAVVGNSAAGQVLVTRSSFPELNHPLNLGVNGSAVVKRTIAFENTEPRLTIPWPSDMNIVLDAVYIPAPAAPLPAPQPTAPASPGAESDNSGVIMAGFGVGLFLLLLSRGRGRR